MPAEEKLQEYRNKRDFEQTPEPHGQTGQATKRPIFVVQQHDARSMHFDFRLEVDGVLVSFAVPKGPSTKPRDKRLAIRTEDHPLEYAAFEGTIPEGQYGGGTVIVWDTGAYENTSEKDGKPLSMAEALAAGHVRVRLFGSKITGGYSLVHARVGDEEKNWLLVKEADDDADSRRNPVATEPRSVASGKTIREMEAADKKGPARKK